MRPRTAGLIVLSLLLLGLLFLTLRVGVERAPFTGQEVILERAPRPAEPGQRFPIERVGTQQAPSAIEHEEPPIRIRIRTVEESGAPLPGVAILALTEEAALALGVTDGRGVLSTELDRSGGSRIEARLAGYTTSARSLGVGTETVVMLLERAVAIEGRVHRHDGSSAGAGIKVLALPAGEVWDSAFFGRCARSDPPRHVALTDEKGRYSIEDTSPDGTYVLFAGGSGLLAGPLHGVKPSEGRNWDLVATPVFGACVSLVGLEGAQVELPDVGFNEYFEQVDTGAVAVIPLGPWTSSVSLLGLAGDAFDDPSRRLLLFLPKDHELDEPAIGPIFYRTSIPGHEEAEIVLWPEPVARGLPLYTMRHCRLEVELGSIEVQLLEREPSTGVRLHQGAGAFATLELIARSPGGRDFVIELEHLQDGQDVVHGIPQGEYTARVVFRNGSHSWPGSSEAAASLTVGALPARIAIDMRELSSLLLDVRWPDGTPYLDSLTVDLGEGVPRLSADGSVQTTGGNPITFRRGPFLIQGLVPNSYSVKIRRPLSAQPDYRPIVVTTTAGETTIVPFVMKDER